MKGIVYLVGAGPGDIGLLTLRAKELIQSADVIVYDRLLNERVLDFAGPGCEKIYVGKEAGFHSVAQTDIEKLLCKLALRGKTVVRLKGGDPYVFGRGAEEALYLWKKKIKFEVIPGVTSAIAGPAYAGIPVTHRDCAGTVTFITGHKKESVGYRQLVLSLPKDACTPQDNIDWKNLAQNKGTLVFLMGLGNLPKICAKLIKNGKNKNTSAAVISHATFNNQKQVLGTLGDITGKTREAKIISPAVIVVGDVVKLSARLDWFGKKNMPLCGKNILVLRSKNNQKDIRKTLEELGADTFPLPVIKHVAVKNKNTAKILKNVREYDYLIITSPVTMEFLLQEIRDAGLDIRSLYGPQICAIGPGTANSLAQNGLRVDILPEKFIAEGLIKQLKTKGIKNKKILIIRSQNARAALPEGLKKLGAKVDVLNIYKVVPEKPSKDELSKTVNLIKSKKLDAVIMMSSSQVKNFGDIIKKIASPRDIPCACIGPETGKEARAQGFKVILTSKEYYPQGLINAVVKYYKTSTKPQIPNNKQAPKIK